MNINEFRYWLEGFSENIKDNPTPEQWKKIKAKLDELTAIKINPYPPTDYIPRLTGIPYNDPSIIKTTY
jgi:hypothetical protein